jgi:uncharacterized glyoxalase superfamily protein PhnB
MNEAARVSLGRSSPGLRYRNVDGAVDWLSRAFGFEVLTVERDQDGYAAYAELAFGSTIIMVGAVRGFQIDRYMKQPDDIGGAETQCSYFVVEDIETHYTRARASGCEIVIDLQSRPNGSRAYTCRDPEGHLWCFGTYDPWQQYGRTPTQAPVAVREPAPVADEIVIPQHDAAPHHVPLRKAAGLSMGIVASAIAIAWVYGEAWRSPEADAAPSVSLGTEGIIGGQFANESFQRAIEDARRRLAFERRTRRAAEREAKTAQAEAARERALRIAAEQTAKDLADQLALTRHTAEQANKDLAQQLSALRDSSSQATKDLNKQLADARKAVEEAQRQAANAALKNQSQTGEEQARLAHAVEQAQKAAADARDELERAKQAQASAEQDAKTAKARLTFISHNARQNSDAAIAEIRKQVASEKTAREAAERETEKARADLARERELKQAAFADLEDLKRKVAAAGGPTAKAGKTILRRAAVARRVTVTAAKKMATTSDIDAFDVAPQKPTRAATEGWSLVSGPHFVKGAD